MRITLINTFKMPGTLEMCSVSYLHYNSFLADSAGTSPLPLPLESSFQEANFIMSLLSLTGFLALKMKVQLSQKDTRPFKNLFPTPFLGPILATQALNPESTLWGVLNSPSFLRHSILIPSSLPLPVMLPCWSAFLSYAPITTTPRTQ